MFGGYAHPAQALTSGAKRFGRPDFVYLPDENAYRCPAGERLPWRFTAVEHAFGTLKAWMRATHFKTRMLEKVRTEMSLYVLA